MDPIAYHQQQAEAFAQERDRWQRASDRLGLLNLACVAGAVILGIAGYATQELWQMLSGSLLFVGFLAGYLIQARLLGRRDSAELRHGIQERHRMRADGQWRKLSSLGGEWVPIDHPFAQDIDLVGPGSLFQRIDVSHTVEGAKTLLAWLTVPAGQQELAARQQAVDELAKAREFRQEFEASALRAAPEDKLDAEPLRRFLELPPAIANRPWLVWAIHGLPVLTLLALGGSLLGLLPARAWVAPLAAQSILLFVVGRPISEAFQLIAARKRYLEAYTGLLNCLEQARFSSPALQAVLQKTMIDSKAPSQYLKRLERWAGLAELRHQFLFHIPLNFLVLWDPHVLLRLETWKRDVGSHMEQVFSAIAEMEALCSLATLRAVEPNSVMPRVTDTGSFEAVAMAHPLLPVATRVPADVSLPGPRSVLVVTGSNMAGKSTLLRSAALNIALALAGGPVCAERFSLSPVRLRASMRVVDSLQEGASYFHAELTKLRSVVADLGHSPPVFFVLDELLRGTNARARQIGARAIVTHLLERGALGLVATHDPGLTELAEEQGELGANAHLTDTTIDGQMVFDYRLRPGVAKGSNALTLLRMAGVAVPESDEAPS